MPPRPRPKRILLKLSGEVFLGDQPFGMDDKVVSRYAAEIAGAARNSAQVGCAY